MAIYKLDPATGIETVSGAISRHRLPDGKGVCIIVSIAGQSRSPKTKLSIEPSSKKHLFKPDSA